MTCNRLYCPRPETTRVASAWAGGWSISYQCDEHARRAVVVGEAKGYTVTLKPIRKKGDRR